MPGCRPHIVDSAQTAPAAAEGPGTPIRNEPWANDFASRLCARSKKSRRRTAILRLPEAERAVQSMTFASIMVSVDLESDAGGRVKIAAHLADAFEGRTIGAAAHLPDQVAPMVLSVGASGLYPAVPRAVVLDRLARAQDLFRTAVGARNRVSWRSALEPGLAFLARQSRVADLIVMGRGCGDGMTGCPSHLDPASVILATGRPVLVVPPGIDHLEGRRIMVAWKDTRETRRAVLDALPILRLAGRVDVVAVTPAKDTSGVADVASYLSAHGIHATSAEHRSDGASDAETLLELSSECASDLIVMGAYGHSRVREMVLGGVTRDFLAHSPVCSFLSH
jgi:nucleotide-binding universal stress UspA family protein